MIITWHGLSCFELTTKTAHGDVTVVIDPYADGLGLRQRSLAAHLVLSSHDEEDANAISSVEGKPFLIRAPGEFEAKGVFAYGVAVPLKAEGKGKPKMHTIYRIESEDMYLAHLGALDRELTNAELEQLKNIDILMVPVGSGRVMNPKLAADVVNQIEPRVVIPMTYAVDGLKENLAQVTDFLKALGVKPDAVPKYKIQKKDLPMEDMQVVLLSRD